MWPKALVAAAVLLFAGSAYAYIDPGTGMSFVSGIGTFIAGFFAIAFGAIVVTFKRWKSLLKGLLSKKPGGGHSK